MPAPQIRILISNYSLLFQLKIYHMLFRDLANDRSRKSFIEDLSSGQSCIKLEPSSNPLSCGSPCARRYLRRLLSAASCKCTSLDITSCPKNMSEARSLGLPNQDHAVVYQQEADEIWEFPQVSKHKMHLLRCS